MSGINKAIVLGRLGKDPEMRHTPAGVPVCSFSIATSEVYTDKTTNEKREITEWHNIVLWRRLAETAEKYLRKGSQVYIEGKIRSRSWDDEAGQKRYITEIVGDTMQLLGRPSDQTPLPQEHNQPAAHSEQTTQPTATATVEPSQAHPSTDDKDDLPF
jgi:single-strand DNA-binding protein